MDSLLVIIRATHVVATLQAKQLALPWLEARGTDGAIKHWFFVVLGRGRLFGFGFPHKTTL
jgi:hypothetical protein